MPVFKFCNFLLFSPLFSFLKGLFTTVQAILLLVSGSFYAFKRAYLRPFGLFNILYQETSLLSKGPVYDRSSNSTSCSGKLFCF